jgi:hypothetical protein
MIELEPAMIYRLDVTGPVEAADGSAMNPRRQFWQMTRATLEGRNDTARISWDRSGEFAFTRAVESDTSTQWDDQYMRMALTFDTAAERYAWLMESLFIARGRLLGAKAIEYDVYRVS